MREGVPRLLDLFRKLGVRASFFVAMGPDRSGMALARVFRKRGFLGKMMRTGAGSMYGWRTMLSGTLLPSRPIGSGSPDLLRRIADEGHEVGIHGWDHVFWHDRIFELHRGTIESHLHRAREAFERAVRAPLRCTASPGWVCSEESLLAQESMGLAYASDTRGSRVFRPIAGGRVLATPQVPITLPTLDEMLGRDGTTADVYNRLILSRLGGTQIHTMHSEAEGRAYLDAAEDLLRTMLDRTKVGPLGELSALQNPPPAPVVPGTVPGRATTVSLQG